jgi:60 kDa SS-A/Ro ribonucleoprotein
MAFNTTYHDLGIRKNMSLEEASRRANENCGNATDISLSVQYALDNRLDIGGLITMTDNEVNTNRHPALALREYRDKRVADLRSVMVATTSTGFSVNDPNDKLGLDVAGFDATVPVVIADFIRGDGGPESDEVEAD